jgi:O-antigen biosynthesis protein
LTIIATDNVVGAACALTDSTGSWWHREGSGSPGAGALPEQYNRATDGHEKVAQTRGSEDKQRERGATVAAQPRVSVFTPSHRNTYLDECLATMLAQTYEDWEWIVLLNGGARWRPPVEDPRVRVVIADDLGGIGAVKRHACLIARGEFLVELDHDDLLASQALALVVEAFDAHPEAGLVYSQCAQILADGGRDESRFNQQHGWTYRDVTVDGRKVLQTNAMLPSPHNVSYIWYAPNHVRAFRRTTYDAAGGYDIDRAILDDQDLMCRMYQQADFHLVDQCLYLQRMHQANTQRIAETNATIQVETVSLYETYIQANALAWAKREGLAALDLGAAHNKPAGYLGLDQYAGPGVDIVADVTTGIDLPDSSVGVIRAVDFLEHITDKIAIINELYRVLAHGGVLLSLTPSTDGRGAFQDPTHVAFYNEHSFWYYTDRAYSAFVPPIQCRFQVSRLATIFMSDWHKQHNISYVQANLIAIKEGPRQGGLLLI